MLTMLTLTFQIDLEAAQGCTAEAVVENGHAEITSVTDPAGRPIDITLDDLERMESVIFPDPDVETTATDLGRRGTFTVKHQGERIVSIEDEHGYPLRRSSALFTEVAECFHIDRYWAMLEDSDVQGHARRCYV